jgi:hypothetical protein
MYLLKYRYGVENVDKSVSWESRDRTYEYLDDAIEDYRILLRDKYADRVRLFVELR